MFRRCSLYSRSHRGFQNDPLPTCEWIFLPPAQRGNIPAMLTRPLRSVLFAAALTAMAAVPFATAQQRARAETPKSVRLYIFDCGKITGVGETAFGFQPGQLKTTEM